jgi:CheY-like chemotaxis protein
MPDRDGFDLLRDIRALGPHAGSIPVVAMTAVVARVDRSRILEAGFQACLPKPFTVDELIEAISNVIDD